MCYTYKEHSGIASLNDLSTSEDQGSGGKWMSRELRRLNERHWILWWGVAPCTWFARLFCRTRILNLIHQELPSRLLKLSEIQPQLHSLSSEAAKLQLNLRNFWQMSQQESHKYSLFTVTYLIYTWLGSLTLMSFLNRQFSKSKLRKFNLP